MKTFINTFFPHRINVYFFVGVMLLFFALNYFGISFFNDIDTQDVKHNRSGGRSTYFYHHK